MHAGLGTVAVTGLAMVSAGVITITPVAPTLRDVVEPTVELAADADWSVIFNKAGQRATGLANSYLDAPFPVTQQSIANQLAYLGELPDVAAIVQQIVANFGRGFAAPFAPSNDTLDAQHEFLYNALPLIQQIPLVDLLFQISPTGQALLDFAASPISGVLLGAAGPLVGPVLVMGSNVQSIITSLTAATPDVGRAFLTLLNTPAQMTDAFLNGGVHVDLTALAEALGPGIGVSFPEGTKVGIAFGGLLSPGGSIFNALDMDYEQDLLGLPLIRVNLATGQGPGLIGSLIDMNKAIAKAIGWDGSGSPLAPSDGPSDRSGLAPVDEVPRAVSSSRVATLSTLTAEADPAVADQDTSGDGAAATGDAVDATTAADADREPVLNAEIADSITDSTDDLTTTPPAGGRHRAKPGTSFGDHLSSAVADLTKGLTNGFAKPAKHAKPAEHAKPTEQAEADAPAKTPDADQPAKSASDDSGSDTE